MVRVHIERFGNPQVTERICARICARDAAERVETGETGKVDVDPCRTFTEVRVAAVDRARRQRRPSYGS